MLYTQRRFQSTLPVWGATKRTSAMPCKTRHFNPRSPCGERRGLLRGGFAIKSISIHAPRVGSDFEVFRMMDKEQQFQSTLPVWGATIYFRRRSSSTSDFNPRSPCGERLCPDCIYHEHIFISIHAPRVGSDVLFFCQLICIHYFNPRSPCGERRYKIFAGGWFYFDFNPRSPCGERPEW